MIYSVLSRAEEVDKALIVGNLQDGTHTRYALFKETSADIRLGVLHANNMVNIKSKFEILEDLLVN